MDELRRPTFAEAIQRLVGEQLSSVTFVMDYWQLGFDGPIVTVLTWLSVSDGAGSLRSGEAGFRDKLCGQIAMTVAEATFEADVLKIRFEDRSELRASARPDDYRGPEAMTVQLTPHDFYVI